ncbi:MAG: NAD(P)-dependent oxidoreductase, partial [Sphingomonadales bacterium]
MKVGFIGLGDMGTPIVKRLLAADFAVTGWNRSANKAEPLIALGMAWAESPAKVAAASDVVISIVTNADAVRAVALGEDGILAGLAEGGIYADMSTIAPDDSREVAAAFAMAGCRMLDAPISASPVTLEAGKASIMVGGDEAAFEVMSPVFLAIGPKLSHIGANGLAVQTKIAINLTLVVEMVAFCEGVALAEKGGVKREVAVEAMLNSVVASPVMGYRGPLILEGAMPEKPLADVTLQQKDVLLALDLARKLGM